MSSTAPSKREHAPNSAVSGKGTLDWLATVFSTSVGAKIAVAVTAVILTSFVIMHLIGNLKIFGGPDSLNGYAKFLKDLGPLLWVFRIGLLGAFALHIFLVVRLKYRSAAARPVPYAYPGTIQASAASRFMLVSGLVILAFVLFHLAHLTFGVIEGTKDGLNFLDLKDGKDRHDVYHMVISGFSNPIVCLFYLTAQVMLFLHLSHGFGSVFQTLGLNSPRFQGAIKKASLGVAFAVLVGNCAIVIAIWAKWIS